MKVDIIEQEERIFTDLYYLGRDIDTVEYRLATITVDTPSSLCKYLLPKREDCTEAIIYQIEFREYIESIYEWKNYAEKQELDAILKDLETRVELWQTLRSISYPSFDRDGTRLELHKIKKWVGEEAFNKGIWPHPLPDAGRNSFWEPVLNIPMEMP